MASPGTWGVLQSVPGGPISISLAASTKGVVAVFDPVTGVLIPGGIPAAAVPQTATVLITSVQLLALSLVPVQLIAAPGVGLYLWPIAYAMEYLYGGIAYSSPAHTNSCYMTYGNPPATASNELVVYDWASATTGIIEATSNVVFQGVCGEGLISLATAENAPLMFSAPAILTLGTGTLKITMSYVVLTA